MTAFSLRRALVALCVLFTAAVPAVTRAALQWDEEGLPAGGSLMVAGGISPGLATLRMIVPAGTADSPGVPLLAPVACRAFLGTTAPDGTPVGAYLARRGWSLELHCELEGAELALNGPAEGLDAMMELLLARLEAPGDLDAEALQAAWRALEADWDRWASSGELVLRAEMARATYGGTDYGVGEQRVRPENAAPPTLGALRAFVSRRYQAGAATLLAAGDLDPGDFLARWRGRLQALPGRLLPLPVRGDAIPVGREIKRADEAQALYIAQFPGPRGDALSAAAAAVAAGVLNKFIDTDVRAPGLCRMGSVWYDFTSPGPRPLEIVLRGIDVERLPALRARIERLCERMRRGEFSEYAMLSAKDVLFERIDAAAGKGKPPRGDDAQSLSLWSREVLREALYFRRWQAEFLRNLQALGKEQVREEAETMLDLDRATLGLLLPGEALD